MAKRARNLDKQTTGEESAEVQDPIITPAGGGDFGIVNLAEEVGRFFGTTEGHARNWLQQRKHLLDALGTVRDRAAALMSELGGEGLLGSRKRGRPRKEGIPVVQPDERPSRKKRTFSAATRAKMAAAQQRRWASRKKT
jgi:hypothetical protein